MTYWDTFWKAHRIERMSGGLSIYTLREYAMRSSGYLEVGLWRGGTFFPTIVGTPLKHAIGIDNFSQFEGGDGWHANYKALAEAEGMPPITFLQKSCWNVDPEKLPCKIDLYYYDGDHTYEAQRMAVTHFLPAMQDQFVMVVDNWEYKDRTVPGTLDGIEDGGLIVDRREIIRESRLNPTPGGKWGPSTVGKFAVFHLRKP